MKARSFLALAALSVFVVTAIQADDAKKKGPACPVSGKAAKDIDGSSLKHNGGKVLFCCANCPKAFAKNTAKFAAKANAQLVSTGQLKQGACAITGKPLNPKQSLTVGGAKVVFCCPGCKGKVAKLEGAAQLDSVLGVAAFKKAKYTVAKKTKKG